ncbi:MAG TPA: PfkB family carbohydrate kinase [Actinomycetota bacterium]|nr:PfkB family carbohydrate kinase [Actinomycetota bacterium]
MLIAGPNLTFDRILRIDELRPGEVLRFSDATVAPGGKGVNVARVARELEYPAVLVVLAPGRTGRAAVELLEAEGLEVLVVPTEGEVRAASTVLERSGRVTVLNEPGPRITSADWGAYERQVANGLAGHQFLVCIGSLPPGAPTDAYARLVSLARTRAVRTLVDAAGDVLATALGTRPDVVTPNLGEADQVLNGGANLPAKDQRGEVRERAMEAAAGLVDRGAHSSLVTVGAGVAVDRGSTRRWIDAPQVFERNPIGAGDSLVGGLVGALERGDDFDAAVRLGVAAASASVETGLPGFIDPERVRALYAKVKV